uniref:Lectin-domain containing receptor kinase A4.1 n=1 Tax=Aegilops tauschii TaxID=37682 RepID=R7W171_AEGTA
MNIAGTRSYNDPACFETGKTCGQSDVYGLGVMLLKIVCGEKPTTQANGKNNLIEKVLKCQANNTILGADDKGLRGQFDGELKSVLEIGLMCVNPDRQRRPHIKRVRGFLMQLLFLVSTSNPTIPSGVNGRGPSSSNTYPAHSPADEEADDSPLLV